MTTARMPAAETGHDPFLDAEVPLDAIRPSPENDQLYDPIDENDPDFRDLVTSVKNKGILDLLVLSQDGYIISGHRRYAAARAAGLKTVPCRTLQVCRADDADAFVRLLREHNRQRNKTFTEKAREALVDIDPQDALRRLRRRRAERSNVTVDELEMDDERVRANISDAKRPMLDAVLQVLEERREFWPLSVRQVHYALLNDPPLKHASKPKSKYANDLSSYKNLDSLLVRARIEKLISWKAINDETRPVTTWSVYRDPQPYIRRELDGLLKGYYRDLLQSQPNHIEVVVEKNTVASICRNICSRYCIPMTSGRGFCSLPPRHEMWQRYKKSGKEKLVLLVVSDFDPEGEVIAESLARYMRDDFDIENICPVKVALTKAQVTEFELPPALTAKESSVNRKKFVDRNGDQVWELEALQPAQLQRLLDEAIRSVLDLDAFNTEQEAEAQDAARIESMRRTVREFLRNTEFGDLEDADEEEDEEDWDDL